MKKITADNYNEEREKIVKANSNLLGIVLREKEEKAQKILSELKNEYINSCNGDVPYDMPVLTDERIRKSRLYKFCSDLPKGADLHVHDMSLLPVNELIGLIARHKEFCINKDKNSPDLIVVPECEKAPENYMRFCDALENGIYNKEELCVLWTFAGAQKSGMNIWDYFERLFVYHDKISNNPSFAADYYEYTFRYYCKVNIMHVEIHLMLTENMDESVEYIKVIRQAYYNVKKEHPELTVRIIGAGVKDDNKNIELTKKCFLNTSFAQETVKDQSGEEDSDFVIGFDLVNEEDKSLPLSAFAPMLLKVKNQFPGMNLYIHGGESLSASNDNLIDAYLLGAKRVGHGLNLYRFPDLHSRYVKQEICLEACMISNQSLGYSADIRNHPVSEYLKTGVALALCSDDPIYMENETLTDDFFAAIVGFDLGIAEIKQLCVNSLMYSGLSPKEKTKSLKYYNKSWTAFIDDLIG